jgi:hypothetical protein
MRLKSTVSFASLYYRGHVAKKNLTKRIHLYHSEYLRKSFQKGKPDQSDQSDQSEQSDYTRPN